jgi:hypothetical protein
MTADKVKVLNGGGESAMEAGVSVPRERPVVKGDGKKREEHPVYGRRWY